MVHGVPVPWPADAVPYTLGGAGALVTDRTAVAVADQILALAQDPARRAAIAARQTASLPRFEPAGQIPLQQAALAFAGAQPPPDTASRAALAAPTRN